MSLMHFLGTTPLIVTTAGVIGLIAVGGVSFGPWLFRVKEAATPPPEQQPSEDLRFTEARRQMVQRQLFARGINDPRILEVMGRIQRHLFVPKNFEEHAYEDSALPIEENQTISQPYIVALMTQLARPTAKSRVLEIGAGSGYQAAVLAELAKEVYSIEILKPLAEIAQERLTTLGYRNVTIRHGDGYQGWPKRAPFDVILVTAAPDHVPKMLEEQLAVGGRMIIPVGRYYQKLMMLEKLEEGTTHRASVIDVLFVPMTGEAERQAK